MVCQRSVPIGMDTGLSRPRHLHHRERTSGSSSHIPSAKRYLCSHHRGQSLWLPRSRALCTVKNVNGDMSSAYRHCIFMQFGFIPVAWQFHSCHVACALLLKRKQDSTMSRLRIRKWKFQIMQTCSNRDYPNPDNPCILIWANRRYSQKATGCNFHCKRLRWTIQTVALKMQSGWPWARKPVQMSAFRHARLVYCHLHTHLIAGFHLPCEEVICSYTELE